MALPATLRKFEIALADADRGIYEQLSWRVAQHPSESERYLGRLVAWIEVGSPSAERLHKASKRAPRVVVYTWKPHDLAAALLERRVHRVPEIVGLPVDLLDALAATLDRANAWELSVSGGVLYITAGGRQLEGTVRR